MPPAAATSAAPASAAVRRRTLTTTRAPIRARIDAGCRPKPPSAPVTIATRPSRDILFFSAHNDSRHHGASGDRLLAASRDRPRTGAASVAELDLLAFVYCRKFAGGEPPTLLSASASSDKSADIASGVPPEARNSPTYKDSKAVNGSATRVHVRDSAFGLCKARSGIPILEPKIAMHTASGA